MANQLKMAMVNAIWILKERGWSQRRIARELGINRETVGKYFNLWRDGPKPAINAPTGSEGSKAAKAPLGSVGQDAQKSGPESQCESFRKVIEDKLQEGLSGQRIYQDLREEYGFERSYYSVRRFVRRLGENKPIPFRRMECMPGDEAQVDFGIGAPVVRLDGKRKRPHVFRIVLSFSRKGLVLGRPFPLGLRRRGSDELLCGPFSQRRRSERHRPRSFWNRRMEETKLS